MDNLVRGLPLYALFLVLVIDNFKGWFSKWINRLTATNVTIPFTLAIMAATLFLAVLKVPMAWENWTWFSVGLCFAAIVLVQSTLGKRVSAVDGLAIGVGLVCICIAVWEIPYQVAQYIIYFVPQMPVATMPQGFIWTELLKHSIPLISGVSLLVYEQKKVEIKANLLTWGLIGLSGIAFASWLLTGMYIDAYYTWTTGMWALREHSELGYVVLSKGSKAVSLLVPFSMFVNGNLVLKQAKVMAMWIVVSIATTTVLAVTWIGSVMLKKRYIGKEPYFKARSIVVVNE